MRSQPPARRIQALEVNSPTGHDKQLLSYFEAFAGIAQSAVVGVDAGGIIQFASGAAEQMFGRDEGTLLGEPVVSFFGASEASGLSKVIQAAVAGQIVETARIFQSRSTRNVREVVAGPVVIDGSAGAVLGIRDVTARVRAEAAVRETEAQLRGLARRLQDAQEVERKRLAREVHDVLGQALTALRLDIRRIRNAVAGDGSESAGATRDGVHTQIVEAEQLVEQTIRTVRRISHDLRPAVLDHFGLAAALEWYCEEFQERSKIECLFRDDTSGRFAAADDNLATALFRITQEALTNVVRHANAGNVAVILSRSDSGEIRLTIEDDGVGIGDEDLRASGSLGLLNMEERMVPWAGRVSVGDREAGGTIVTVRVQEPQQNG